MSESKQVKRLSRTITEEIVIEEEKKHPFKMEQREKSPDLRPKGRKASRPEDENNSKCCGIFSCCGVHNTINGNNNNVNTDKTIDSKADVNVGVNTK